VDIDTVRTASQGTRMILVRITPSGSSVDVEIGSEATGRMVKDMVLEELEERQEIASAEMLRKAAASDTPLALGSREIEDEDILFEEGVEDDSTLIMSIDDDLIELHTGLSRFATRDQNSVDSLGDARAVKTNTSPDSNNVFLQGLVPNDTPCQVEFKVHKTRDEMVFAVTSREHMDEVAKVSGFANMRMKNIWGYGKHTGRMPVVIFDSVQRSCFGHDVQGFAEGDVVTVSVNPPEKRVQFYRNGELMIDNLTHPAGVPLCHADSFGIYAMLDDVQDDVEILSVTIPSGRLSERLPL